MTQKCENCRFWKHHTTVTYHGSCRRRSPAMTKVEHSRKGVWPATSINDWCGDFENQEASNDQDTQAHSDLVNAVNQLNLRGLVAGWSGEGREDGPFEPHPYALGVTLKTNAGTVYAIDAALRALTESQQEGAT